MDKVILIVYLFIGYWLDEYFIARNRMRIDCAGDAFGHTLVVILWLPLCAIGLGMAIVEEVKKHVQSQQGYHDGR